MRKCVISFFFVFLYSQFFDLSSLFLLLHLNRLFSHKRIIRPHTTDVIKTIYVTISYAFFGLLFFAPSVVSTLLFRLDYSVTIDTSSSSILTLCFPLNIVLQIAGETYADNDYNINLLLSTVSRTFV